MRIKILTVGENRVPYLIKGEQDYLQRLMHYCTVEMQTVKGEKIKNSRNTDIILDKEAERILYKIADGSKVVALDKLGKSFSSEELAGEIRQWQNSGIKTITIVVGGPLGLSRNIINSADMILSMSQFTFTHEMVKLIGTTTNCLWDPN